MVDGLFRSCINLAVWWFSLFLWTQVCLLPVDLRAWPACIIDFVSEKVKFVNLEAKWDIKNFQHSLISQFISQAKYESFSFFLLPNISSFSPLVLLGLYWLKLWDTFLALSRGKKRTKRPFTPLLSVRIKTRVCGGQWAFSPPTHTAHSNANYAPSFLFHFNYFTPIDFTDWGALTR